MRKLARVAAHVMENRSSLIDNLGEFSDEDTVD
jgi:hypothetical protein